MKITASHLLSYFVFLVVVLGVIIFIYQKQSSITRDTFDYNFPIPLPLFNVLINVLNFLERTLWIIKPAYLQLAEEVNRPTLMRLVYIAAKHKVPVLLNDGPKSIEYISQQTSLNPKMLRRM